MINKQQYKILHAQNGIIPPKQFQYDSTIQNKWGCTVAVYLEIKNIEVPKQWKYDPLYKLKDNSTTAMKIAENGKIPSQYWNHDPTIQDNYGFTVAQYLEKNNIETPKQWQYNPLFKLEYNITTAMRIALYSKVPSEHWYHDPKLQDDFGNTVAITLAKNNIIPPEQWNHSPYIANIYEKTVQDYLIDNNKEIPDNWKVIDKQIEMTNEIQQYLKEYCKECKIKNQQIIINYPQYQKNDYTNTFAMYLANNGIIPPKEFQHDPNIKDEYGFTVALYLAQNNIVPSCQWQTDPNIIYKYQNYRKHYERTIAHILASKGIIPSKEWQHDPELKDNLENTVEDYLKQNNIEIPYQWKIIKKEQNQFDEQIEQHLNEFCTKYKIYRNIVIQNPSWQNNTDKETFAMYLATDGIIPPKELIHNPSIQNNHGTTVAMFLSYNKIIPPIQWEHSPYITNYQEMTVQDYLIQNNIEVPQKWKIINKQIQMTDQIKQKLNEYCEEYDIKNQQIIINYPQYQKNKEDNSLTFAMYLSIYGIIPPKEFEHDPNIKHHQGFTVAFLLSFNEIVPPKQWQVDPYIIYKYQNYNIIFKRTIAHILASNSIIPPQNYNHYSLLKDNYGNTVAILLSSKGIIPPKEWTHDINIKNINNQSIKSNLLLYGYIYINNQFIKLSLNNIKQYIQIEILDDICQICLNEGQQEFIKTNCKHRICIDCFIEMIKITKQKLFCPICRQQQWFKLIDQTQ